MITQTFDLNLIPNSAPIMVHVNQYDIGEGRLVATLYNGSQLYTPASGATALIEGTKPDNKGYSYPATISGSTVTADLQLQMSCVAGKSRVNIIIQEGNNKTGTFVFYLDVQATGLADDVDISESDIAPYIDGAQAAARSAEASATTASEAASTATAAVASIGDSVQRAETAATTASTAATSASESATTATTAATNASASATSASASAVSAAASAAEAEQYAQGGLIFKSSVTFANIPITGMKTGDMYNITDDFTTDSRFEEGAGIAVKAGTNIAWNTNSKWDLLAVGGSGSSGVGKTMESGTTVTFAQLWGQDQAKLDFPVDSTATISDHAEIFNDYRTRDNSGNGNLAIGKESHAEGNCALAYGNYTHVEGENNVANGAHAHAEGSSTYAKGINSHSEGLKTLASGDQAHAEGSSNTASGVGSHAEGSSNTASGVGSHAEGALNTASSYQTHAEGAYTTASNYQAHAEGYYATASGQYSHAEGNHTTAGYTSQHASGQFNNNKSDTYFEVGNGTADNARSNAFEVTSDGYIRTHNNNVKIAFGVDANGNYGYIKAGADTVYPFKSSAEPLEVYIYFYQYTNTNNKGGSAFEFDNLMNDLEYTHVRFENIDSGYNVAFFTVYGLMDSGTATTYPSSSLASGIELSRLKSGGAGGGENYNYLRIRLWPTSGDSSSASNSYCKAIFYKA